MGKHSQKIGEPGRPAGKMVDRASKEERHPWGVLGTGRVWCPGLAPPPMQPDAWLGWLHLQALRRGQPITKLQSPLRTLHSSTKVPLASLAYPKFGRFALGTVCKWPFVLEGDS